MNDRLRREYAETLKQSYLSSGFKQGFEAGYAKAKEDFERPQWIPCSKRLPEEYHTYLVTKLDPNPSKSTFTTLAYFYTEETGWDIDDVIAWMPFPKPYKKEGDMDG
jgi:hypothetical protein